MGAAGGAVRVLGKHPSPHVSAFLPLRLNPVRPLRRSEGLIFGYKVGTCGDGRVKVSSVTDTVVSCACQSLVRKRPERREEVHTGEGACGGRGPPTKKDTRRPLCARADKGPWLG